MTSSQCSFIKFFVLQLVLVLIMMAAADESLIPKFSEQTKKVIVVSGRKAIIPCRVDNLGMFRVMWKKIDTEEILTIDRTTISRNRRISIKSHNRESWYLGIEDVQKRDGGEYSCNINTDPMQSLQIYLEVLEPPTLIANESSTDLFVYESSNVTLVCKGSGFPPPQIMWRRHDDKSFFYEGANVISTDGDELTIVNVSRMHMGTYVCIARNGVPPSTSKQIMLTVHFTPMIVVSNHVVVAHLGQDVVLECHVEAYPDSMTYWANENGDMITLGDKYVTKITASGYNRSMLLIIRNVSNSDFSTYSCVAKNYLGQAEGFIRLEGYEF